MTDKPSTRKPYKVSFCITCKGRLEHLKQTLPQNLKNTEDYPNTEFVVLDYDSQDGLEDWIKTNYRREIESGRIIYAKYQPAPTFRIPHAKNMSHRLATGDIVCNLDADNIVATGFAPWLNQQFSINPNIYIRPHRIQTGLRFAMGTRLHGIAGRVAMMRDRFMELHGYDENYHGRGEDSNLCNRAQVAGCDRVNIPYAMLGDVLQHSDASRLQHLDPDEQVITEQQLVRERGVLSYVHRLTHLNHYNEASGLPPSNPNGNFGCGHVRINFKSDTDLTPVLSSPVVDDASAERRTLLHRSLNRAALLRR